MTGFRSGGPSFPFDKGEDGDVPEGNRLNPSTEKQERRTAAGPRPLRVSELTAQIKGQLERRFDGVRVEGEISNWRPGPTGHVYFVLKDERAVLNCVMWRSTAQKLLKKQQFADGARVEAAGRISVYEPRGAYQLVVDKMEAAGLGDLYRRFIELRDRLDKEGLFALERKRALPAFPRCIGVVTSPRGAALRDILNVLRRRFAGVQVVLEPARVQGVEAAPEIARGIERLNKRSTANRPDLLIVARGGGSFEDLWPFNEEPVARAIAASAIPVISGVGHEIDTTIADLAADLRAPTPSAAAEIAVGTVIEWRRRLHEAERGLIHEARMRVAEKRGALQRLAASRALESPRERLNRQRQRLDDLWMRLERSGARLATPPRQQFEEARRQLGELARERIRTEERRLAKTEAGLLPGLRKTLHAAERRHEKAAAALGALDPRAVLGRGYAIVARREKGRWRVIDSAAKAREGAALRLEFGDGRLRAHSLGPEPPEDQLEFEWPEKSENT